MSRKEIFKELYREVSELYYKLQVSCVDKVCDELLYQLQELIQTKREEVDEIELKRGMTLISDAIIYQRQTDVGISHVKELILGLLHSIDEVIAEEELKENSDKFKKLFLTLAEHSTEIAHFVNFDEIFS